jgi:hypothetical protein
MVVACLAALGCRASVRILWYTGCAFFALAFLGFLVQGAVAAIGEPDTFGRIWAVVSQVICAALAAMVFRSWWLPKRKEIDAPDHESQNA